MLIRFESVRAFVYILLIIGDLEEGVGLNVVRVAEVAQANSSKESVL